MHYFKCGAHIVIEPAHQPRPDLERDAAVRQIALHGFEVRTAVFTKVVEDRGQPVDDRLVRFYLAVEDAQGIRHHAPLAVLAHGWGDAFELAPQRFHET